MSTLKQQKVYFMCVCLEIKFKTELEMNTSIPNI